MIRGMLWDSVGGVKNEQSTFRLHSSFFNVIYLIFLVGQLWGRGEGLSSDGLYLLEFKRSITCGSHEILSNWNENDSYPCSWWGVTCNPYSRRVVSLRMVGRRTAQKTLRATGDRVSSDEIQPDGSTDRIPCTFTGTLSPAIGKLSELRLLSIIFSRISGELPQGITNLKFLQTLDLRSNLLGGGLPSDLGKLSNLRVLNLDRNFFQGRIPAELSSCQQLRKLSLSGNLLSGSIPPSLGGLPLLQKLSLSNNRLVGSIPKELGRARCRLSYIDLSGNRLTGNIPPELGVCLNLRWLLLNFNYLVGSIPSDLSQLSSLKSLQVAGNYLSGCVPAKLAHSSKLEFLVLSSRRGCLNRTEGNYFRVVLPPELTLLPRLHIMCAPGAGSTEGFPFDWGLQIKLSIWTLTQDALSRDLHLGWSRCKKLVFVDLSLNQLTGSISGQLRVQCMTLLNMIRNNLLERISDALMQSERSAKRIHFGKYLFQGNFIRCLTIRGAIVERSPCYLNFSGGFWMICASSWEVVLETSPVHDWTCSYPAEEPQLAASRRSMLEGVPTSPPNNKKKLGSILVAAITSGCVIAIAVFVLGLLFQCTRQRSPTGPSPQPGRKVVVTFVNINHPLTYENVVRATGNFSIDNLIGGGGFGATYKAEVKQGLLVAVKRLAIGRFQGVQQFDTEIRTLGRIRHPNLVTLIGYHASQEEMFLIYNFFSQGNLETLIHGHREELDWRTRHSIALRIAEALAYLHDDCVPRVLHRDIKPSNILLDDDLNAHLSDFGLARLLGASETHATTDVAGTFGYVAPEYAMTCRVTDKADVYSYGVVLLELLSGKRALDPSFCVYGDGFNIVSWACLLIRRERASEVFTHRLWEVGPEKQLLEALKLAVLCTVDQLSVRPTMKEVVDILGKIRPMVSTS